MNLIFHLSFFLCFPSELTFECRVENVSREKLFNPFDICNKACLLTQVKEKHLMLVHVIRLKWNLVLCRQNKKSDKLSISWLIRKFSNSVSIWWVHEWIMLILKRFRYLPFSQELQTCLRTFLRSVGELKHKNFNCAVVSCCSKSYFQIKWKVSEKTSLITRTLGSLKKSWSRFRRHS